MPDVLRLYLDFGLHEDGSRRVGLKTPPIHEALILSNLGASRETWELMERLDKNIELLRDLLTGRHCAVEQIGKEHVWRMPANASNITISSPGHLVCIPS
ncbi:hypothetical protein DFJ58DRAFT_657123 [Suillus subalutaceus]|uniref:uncharacterized protein n=1 Tax=Suillus subalutaceus TaxID=48586 RepID=UPI001B8689A9|nr:uncharacterized protein DFJ58DRAFT_657123 [Suillus subalutaceus]KAG1862085.1 hypothetical protein DFJ58DRAFT_657123 [Suillus subalutaceus]